MRLLFVSNLFPDSAAPYRGLDNATVLHALAPEAEIRTLVLRPVLPWQPRRWQAREEDAALHPRFVATPYLPKFGSRWNHRLYARALRKAFAQTWSAWRPDAVLVAWLYPDACAVARLQAEFPCRFVAVAQGTDVHHYLRLPARRKIMLAHLRKADCIITRSADLARMLAEAGLPAERLHPIYNGVHHTTFRPPSPDERSGARATLGLPADAKVVLFVGNFLPVKNPHLLLEAHARLLQSSPDLADARLVLVGTGPLEGALRRQVESLGLGKHVHFAGRADPAGVARAMHSADVLALPSENEGVPNVVLEAFATGLPVVASRVGGLPEVLDAPFLGELVPPSDAAALSTALQRRLRQSADSTEIATRGQSFTWARTASAYRHLLTGAAIPAR